MKKQLIAKIGDFEFRAKEGLADKRFKQDFEKFFRLVVIDDEEIDYLDSFFASSFMNVILDNVMEDQIKPIVLEFVVSKFDEYFDREAGEIS